MAPKISVLLPTYNGAAFIEQQIRSIQSQTERSWELLICDDGSSDGTQAITAALARTDDRIRILPSIGNKGQKRRLIELLAASGADFIAISDQDDVWDDDKLSLLMSGIGNHDLAFGASHIITETGQQLGHSLLDSLPPLPQVNDRLIYLFKPAVSAHAMIVRRDMITDMSLKRGTHFDWLISLDCAFRSGTTYVRSAITYHRMHNYNQNNGFARDNPLGSSKFSKKAIKKYLFSGPENRIDFLSACEHLSESTVVPCEVSNAFLDIKNIIRKTWYKPHVPRLSYARLCTDIEMLLTPFAGSDHDLTYARRALRRLTSSPLLIARISAHMSSQ